MRHKILWVGLSFLLVAALVLASCAPAVGEQEEEEEEPVGEQEEEEEEEEEEPAVGEPQYGGTLTVFSARGQSDDPPSPDIQHGYNTQNTWLETFQEKPFIGDFETYGPRGTGEFAFRLSCYIPEQYLTGNLLESWDVTPEKIVWHVRPGIMWHGNKPWVMESRELTAEDILADLEYFRDAPAGIKRFDGLGIGDMYVEDNSVVLEWDGFDMTWLYLLGYEDRAVITPPELVAAGADRWKNQVGTGPFMLKEYVVGSHMTYIRNPDYWKKTTIDGVEYGIPFIDEMIRPIIPDVSTQLAALRTGTIDYFYRMTSENFASLDRLCPELLKTKFSSYGNRVCLKVDEPPLDSLEIRRALTIGTDMKAFATLAGMLELPVHWYPVYFGDPATYTSIEDLPASARELYDYNPEKAKQMLADAGYPDGLQLEYWCGTQTPVLDAAALLADQWAKIGVDLEIKAHDAASFDAYRYDRAFNHCHRDGLEVGNPVLGLEASGKTGHWLNFSGFSDEYYDDMCSQIKSMADVNERNPLIKEAAVYMLEQCVNIPLNPTPQGVYWWPWLKNYYGEVNVGDGSDYMPFLACTWIDEDLKAEMGY